MTQNYIQVQEVSQELHIRPEVYVRIVTSFSEALGEKLKTLSEALADKDEEQMRKTLHEIRGAAGNLRLKGIAEPAITLNEAVKAEEPHEKLAQYLEPLKAEAEKLKQGVKDITPS